MTFFPTAAFSPCHLALFRSTHRVGKQYNERHGVFPDSFQPGSRSSTCLLLSSVESSVQVFEPVVNIPALSSFLVIAVIFSSLILRVRSVEQAAERRKAALVDLRRVKSMQLSASSDDDRPDADKVARALKEYEDALKSEEDLRTLIPGVRVVAPNQSAGSNEQDITAARQFLGIELNESSSPRENNEEEREGLSAASVAILTVVALSQLALLYMLSFDPMDAYSTPGGLPPLDLPPSSW